MDVRVQGGEAQVTFDLRDLEDILMDLHEMRGQITYYRSKRDQYGDIEGGSYEFEPRTQDFIDALYEKGIK